MNRYEVFFLTLAGAILIRNGFNPIRYNPNTALSLGIWTNLWLWWVFSDQQCMTISDHMINSTIECIPVHPLKTMKQNKSLSSRTQPYKVIHRPMVAEWCHPKPSIINHSLFPISLYYYSQSSCQHKHSF